MKDLVIKSVDTMKQNKDNITGQLSDAEILDICQAIKREINPTHIAISIPLDTNADMVANGSTPSPRTMPAVYQKWCDTIHSVGCKVLHRGTFSGIEAVWNFPYWNYAGTHKLEQGTVVSAPTDGNTTWLGKIYFFIVNNAASFASGDVWAPIPEPTNVAFDVNKCFLNTTNETDNFATFFSNIKPVSDAAFASIGKSGILTGYTTQNYSEINSGWLPDATWQLTSFINWDHYGTDQALHSATEMDSNTRTIASRKGKTIFHQEWGDYWNAGVDFVTRWRYLQAMYSMWTNLQKDGILVGYNYWGGWDGSQEGILYQDSVTGKWRANARGKLLGQFFNGTGGTKDRLPVLDANGNY